MKQIFVVIMSFLLGLLVILTWLFQQHDTPVHVFFAKRNLIPFILLVVTWSTPFVILFYKPRKKK